MLNLNDYFNRFFLREFFQKLSLENLCHLLDLGCGRKPYASLYREIFDEVTYADIESRADKVDVIANVENLPFEDQSFDVVLFSEVIEHVPDDESALKEIHRILVPDGNVIITFPFMYRIHEIPNDYRRYTEFGIQRLLNKSGFDVMFLRRRGDLFSLSLTLIGNVFHGLVTAPCRLPLIGRVFRPLLWLFEWLLQLIYKGTAMAQFRAKHLNPSAVGVGLDGYAGYFAVWTLGYCVLARKESEE